MDKRRQNIIDFIKVIFQINRVFSTRYFGSSNTQIDQAELKIRSEITQAWEYYMDYCRQVENYNNGLLENAENVRKGKIYSYQRGETSLLEVLNAQRTYNEIQTTYYETRFDRTPCN